MDDHTVKMTYEKAEEARRLFQEGMKTIELCKRFNLSRSAMRALLRGDSWPPKTAGKKEQSSHLVAKNKWETVYALWCDGKSNKEISQISGISESYISLIQWAIKNARKDPAWAEAQKNKNCRKMAEWADEKARKEITKDDWKNAACELAKRNSIFRNSLTLNNVLKHVLSGTNLLVFVELDAGTKQNFTVTIMRGQRFGDLSQEFSEWLEALNLEVDHISACKEDVNGNKDMLSIFCKPIKVTTQEVEK